MQSELDNGDVLVDSRHDIIQHHVASPAALSDAEGDMGVDSYFDLAPEADTGASTPSSIQSHPLSMIDHANAVAPAFAALQYLPVPLIVLSSQKTVILANEAMGRLLNINMVNCPKMQRPGGALSVTDLLRGFSMGQLGMDLLQGGSPILVSWDVS